MFYFLVSKEKQTKNERRGRRGSVGAFCEILLRPIQAIIRNAILHINCEFMPSQFWRFFFLFLFFFFPLSLSLSLSLFEGEKTEYKNVEQKKKKDNCKHFDTVGGSVEYVQ